MRFWLMLALASGCARGQIGGAPDDAQHAQTGPDGSVATDARALDARALDARPIDAARVGDATCEGFVEPTPCATLDGFNVYCVAPGDTLITKASVTYPATPSIATIGAGSTGTNNQPLGYFSAGAPFTCAVTGCDHAVKTDGCTVFFDLTVTAPTTGTGVFAIQIASTAAAGDYLLGYADNYYPDVSPDFYVRVAAAVH